jgi:transposase-like protein
MLPVRNSTSLVDFSIETNINQIYMTNTIKNLNDLDSLRKPIKGFTYFANNKGELVILTHKKSK